MAKGVDPHEEWLPQDLQGEVHREDLFDEAGEDHFRDQVEVKNSLNPDTHELVTKINEHDVPVDSLRVRFNKKAKKYTVTAVEEAGDHKSEIVLATLSFALVLGAVKYIKPRLKK